MTTRSRVTSVAWLSAALLVLAVLVPARGWAQSVPDTERYFRVELEPEAVPRGGWAVQGYVYSTHAYRVNGVRLQVDVLDDQGQVLNQVYGWVPGDVPSGGRAYFFVSVPRRGVRYRAKVLSYFLVAREAQ